MKHRPRGKVSEEKHCLALEPSRRNSGGVFSRVVNYEMMDKVQCIVVIIECC